MAPSELVWLAEDGDGWRSTAPWPASGAAILELRPRAPGWAWLRELRPGAAPRPVARVDFFNADGRRRVGEQLPGGREQWHVLPTGCASVRLRWEKAAGRWKLWAEAGGERLVLEATFDTPEPQLELYTGSENVDCFDFCLLPPPLLVGTLQSPPPAHAQLQARIDQLTAELETEKLQNAGIQQEKQKLQQQLDESKRRYELLTQKKEEETQKVESAQHENKALHQRIDSLMEQLETEKQQVEITENLQKQLAELAQEKAEEMKKAEDLQQKNETLQQRIALLTQKAQKSEMTQCILQLKEQCDAFLAFSRSDSNDPQAEEGPGATPVSEDAVDSFTLVGDQSDMYSDTSSRSAKCFLPNTALHGVDGHLLRVEKLKIGDRVRLLDQTEASVVGMHLHRAKKKPYNLVELTTRQGLSTVSKSHRVAVPSLASEGEACEAERADQLGVGNTVFVGGKQQKLTKVTSRQERTHLYEVRLEPDGPLEMLQLPSFGLVTFGSVASDQPDAEMDGGEAEA